MEVNYNSGFLLPLESERFFPTVAENPSKAEYLKCLANIYENYPFFDDVLYPFSQAFYELYEPTSPLCRLRWTGETLNKIHEQDDVVAIRNRLKQAFLWQRWEIIEARRKSGE